MSSVFNKRKVFFVFNVCFMSFVGYCFRACTNSVIPDFFELCSREFVYGIF